MMEQLSDALTELHDNESLWSASSPPRARIHGRPRHAEILRPHRERRNLGGNVDVFGLGKRCKKPIVTAVQGIVFTIGIELMLAGEHRSWPPMTHASARWEAKRGIAPFAARISASCRAPAGATRCIICSCAMNSRHQRAREIGLVQEVVPAGQQVERAMALAAIIARNAPLGIQVTKEAAAKYVEHGEAAALAASGLFSTRCARRNVGDGRRFAMLDIFAAAPWWT